MIWVAHQAPNTPLSDQYDASGAAVPWARNVNLGGQAWDVYLYQYVILHCCYVVLTPLIHIQQLALERCPDYDLRRPE
jgi:hypothetical protein